MKKTKKYKEGGQLFLSMAEGGSMGTIPSMYGELPQYEMGMDVSSLMTPYIQDFEHYYGGNYPILQGGGQIYDYYVTGINPEPPVENTMSYDDAMKQYMIDYMKARYTDIETANPRTLQDRIPYPTMPMTERQQRRVEAGKNPSTLFNYYPADPSFAGTRELNRWNNQTLDNAGVEGFDRSFRKELPSPEEMEMDNDGQDSGINLSFGRRGPKPNYDTGPKKRKLNTVSHVKML